MSAHTDRYLADNRFAVTGGPQVVLRTWRHVPSGWRVSAGNRFHAATKIEPLIRGPVAAEDVIEIEPVLNESGEITGWRPKES